MERFWTFLKKLTTFFMILLTPILGVLLFVDTFYREMVPEEVLWAFVGVAAFNGIVAAVAYAKT